MLAHLKIASKVTDVIWIGCQEKKGQRLSWQEREYEKKEKRKRSLKRLKVIRMKEEVLSSRVKVLQRPWRSFLRKQQRMTSIWSTFGSWGMPQSCSTTRCRISSSLWKESWAWEELKKSSRESWITITILDALSSKIGINLWTMIAPPTTKCLLCCKDLTPNNEPVHVPLHTIKGPQLATKYTWECRSCRCVSDFGKQGQIDCSSKQIYYQVDMFGNWVFLNQTIWVLKCKKCEANMAPCL